jgi:hypothetical protein
MKYSEKELKVIIEAYTANARNPTLAAEEATKRIGRPVTISAAYYHGRRHLAELEGATKRTAVALERARKAGDSKRIAALIEVTPTDVLVKARDLIRIRRGRDT